MGAAGAARACELAWPRVAARVEALLWELRAGAGRAESPA
jgi:hypothetical protein